MIVISGWKARRSGAHMTITGREIDPLGLGGPEASVRIPRVTSIGIRDVNGSSAIVARDADGVEYELAA